MVVQPESKVAVTFSAVGCASLSLLLNALVDVISDIESEANDLSRTDTDDVKKIDSIISMVNQIVDSAKEFVQGHCSEWGKGQNILRDVKHALSSLRAIRGSIPESVSSHVDKVIEIMETMYNILDKELRERLIQTIPYPTSISAIASLRTSPRMISELTKKEREILMKLAELTESREELREGVTLTVLSKELGIPKPNLYRYLRFLTVAGLVERIFKDEKVLYKLSEKGKELIKES